MLTFPPTFKIGSDFCALHWRNLERNLSTHLWQRRSCMPYLVAFVVLYFKLWTGWNLIKRVTRSAFCFTSVAVSPSPSRQIVIYGSEWGLYCLMNRERERERCFCCLLSNLFKVECCFDICLSMLERTRGELKTLKANVFLHHLISRTLFSPCASHNHRCSTHPRWKSSIDFAHL